MYAWVGGWMDECVGGWVGWMHECARMCKIEGGREESVAG